MVYLINMNSETNYLGKESDMKTIIYLAEQLGENSSTGHEPVAVYDPEGMHSDIDFDTTIMCCYSYDDDRQVPKVRYSTRAVEMPEWLDAEEWLENRTAWKWARGCGCEQSWPEVWQRFIAYGIGHDTARKLAVVKLLRTKKFRSEFRSSLRAQLDTWLDTPEGERKYDSPFSPRQWASLCRFEQREAARLDNRLYYGI